MSRLSLQLFCLPSLVLRSLHLIEVESIIAKEKEGRKEGYLQSRFGIERHPYTKEPHWPNSVCMYVCICVCILYNCSILPNHWTDLHQQIQRLTLIAIGYLDLKYKYTPTIFNHLPQKIWGSVMLNQWEIEDSCKAHSKINRKIFVVYGSNMTWTWFSTRMVNGPYVWGLGRWVISFGGNVPKKPKRGVNMHFQAKLA